MPRHSATPLRTPSTLIAATRYREARSPARLFPRFQRHRQALPSGTGKRLVPRDPRERPPIYLAELARVEVVAALRRTGRLEGLHASFIDALVSEFERHLDLSVPARRAPMYRLVPLAPAVLELAAVLCNRHWQVGLQGAFPLRSLDAIQLAAAILAAASITDELLYVTADARLAAIAELEGLAVVNPLSPPQPK